MIGRISTQNKHYNSKPVAPPSDFYIATMLDGNTLTYLSNTFSTINIQPYFNTNIINSNEVYRNNNDLYITGNFGFTQSYIFKLKDCKFIKNRLLFQGVEENYIANDINYVQGLTYMNDFIYLSSRESPTTFANIVKINPTNLQIVSKLVLPILGQTNNIIGYKDNLYTLVSLGTATASFFRISPDLATYSVLFITGTSAARRVRPNSAFSLHNDEIYIPILRNQSSGFNLFGMEVYNLSGTRVRQTYDVPISSSASAVPLPWWLAFHNEKLIVCNSVLGPGTSSHSSLVRMDPITLFIEDSIRLPCAIVDDNSIFSDGYIYLNGIYVTTYTLPQTTQLIKVKYDNFTDFTTLISPFGGTSGSGGSINPLFI
jgi:hypothetical protein